MMRASRKSLPTPPAGKQSGKIIVGEKNSIIPMGSGSPYSTPFNIMFLPCGKVIRGIGFLSNDTEFLPGKNRMFPRIVAKS